MKPNTHIIHCVNLEIAVDDQQVAPQVQEDALRILKDEILPAIEKYLDGIDAADKSYRFEKFNLDAGLHSPETFSGGFAEFTIKQFSDRIAQAMKPLPGSEESEPETYTEIPPEELYADLLIHFLKTGYLPWWATGEQLKVLETQLVQLEFTGGEPFRSRLLALVQTDRIARTRLTLQFSEEYVLRLISALVNSEAPEISKEYQLTGKTLLDWLTDLSEAHPLFREAIAGKMSGVKIDKPSKVTQKEASDIALDEGGIFVQHAGLVLLHPFFEYFFMEFGLLQNHSFVNEEAQFTAMHFLHFLATGKEAPMEYELAMEKYLCGWNTDQAVPRNIILSAKMKQESDKLLHAAIKHWKALKNTSPAGLREAFLQRNGKLVLDEYSHRLIVESTSIDVLLGYLPWGIGIVKLPWLEHVLIVDWTQ